MFISYRSIKIGSRRRPPIFFDVLSSRANRIFSENDVFIDSPVKSLLTDFSSKRARDL